jgi:hypothetical protein
MAPDDQVVRVPRYAFEVMAAVTALGEDDVAVMLLLLVRVNGEGYAELDMDPLPSLLTVRSERVLSAVSSIIKRGWITSVDEAAMQSRILACNVHPAFLHSDYDTLMKVVTARMFKTVAH